MFKRINQILALCLAACLAVLCTAGQAEAIKTSATSTCVMDLESGRILYEDNDHVQRPIASITKIMTGLLACEAADEIGLETVLTCTPEARAERGSSMYMETGDKISYRSCIYACMLRSGNDAAMLLAQTIAGDKEHFVEKMNQKAKEIGMTETLYGNPNGLTDEGNYSTAHDMCLLGCYAMQNQLFADTVKVIFIKTDDGYEIENHNMLLSDDSRCIGVKTGYTDLAGRTLVTCMEDPDTGHKIITCTLNDPTDYKDHQAIADWAFQKYDLHRLCKKGQNLTSFTVSETGETFQLTAAESVSYPLTEKEAQKVKIRMVLPRRGVLLQEGDTAGHIIYSFKGQEIGRSDLVCTLPKEG